MKISLKEVDKLEITTLQDNYVDFFAFEGNNSVVQRPIPVKQTEQGLELGHPPVAEHGWSCLIDTTIGKETRRLLFDFGWSQDGAAENAEILNQDLHQVDQMALSHGHIDHFGGLQTLYKRIGKPGIEIVLHPAAFRNPRYGRIAGGMKVNQPSLSMDMLSKLELTVTQAETPQGLADDNMLFLTGIPRNTDFEKGIPNFFYLDENNKEQWDAIDDDSAIVVALKGKGLVVISGCGHAGIINTIEYAREVTGIHDIHAVVGGFHLTGAQMQPAIAPTVDALKRISPDYIVPTHCTGWDAITRIEREMPERFILNMSGTQLIFSA